MNEFIPPSTNITGTGTLEWKHYANLSRDTLRQRWNTPTGKGLLKALAAGGYTCTVLESHVGKFGGKFDLRGIPLANADLHGIDLSGIDFFVADLSCVNFTSSNLSSSFLSECDIRGACFNWAKLDEALLDNVRFNQHTGFLGVDLHTVNFTLATLLYDLALAQQRIQQLEQHYPLFAWFLKVICDYGRSFWRYLTWVVGFVVSYALAYVLLLDKSFLDCLYFSIVTFATVGYGDILPVTDLAKAVVMSEIVIGYLMGGLLVAILAKRVVG